MKILRLEIHRDEGGEIAGPGKRELRPRHRNVAKRSFDALQFFSISAQINTVFAFRVHPSNLFRHIVTHMPIDIFLIIRARIENRVVNHDLFPFRKVIEFTTNETHHISATNVRVIMNMVSDHLEPITGKSISDQEIARKIITNLGTYVFSINKILSLNFYSLRKREEREWV